jgi:hypothetical protein
MAREREGVLVDPVVGVALKYLDNQVGSNGGLTHPEDKKAAVEAFVILWKAGYELLPQEIESWALLHDWTAAGARGLGEVADGVRHHQRFVLVHGGPSWNSDALEVWRSEAAGGGR